MTEILYAVSPSVFSWIMLGRRSSAAFLLPRPEKGVWWPTPCRTHPVRVAAVALKLTGLVNISRNAATGRATCSLPPLSSYLNVIRENARGEFCTFLNVMWGVLSSVADSQYSAFWNVFEKSRKHCVVETWASYKLYWCFNRRLIIWHVMRAILL